MIKLIMEYCLFIGMGLYLVSTILFLYLFLRTLRTKDGIGLVFLKMLTFGVSLGSFIIFLARANSYFGFVDPDIGRAIAIVNPIILVGLAFYLNFLFHQKTDKLSISSKDVKEIKENVKIVKKDVKEVKKEIVK